MPSLNIHSRKTSGLNLDLSAVRAKLADETGPRFWRSLEEIAQTEEFTHYLHREFPEQASEWTDLDSRRNFLRVMGASLALAGVGMSGCDYIKNPPEKILPYVRQPENLTQGKPLYYATAVTLGGYGSGVVVESHMGRPTMVEGNEKHPESQGAVDAKSLAVVLGLYDPDRSKTVLKATKLSTFDTFLIAALSNLDAQRAKKGAGIRLLTETVTSPTLARQIKLFLAEYPEAKWHQFEPVGQNTARVGAKLAFGRDVSVKYNVDKADVILAIDSDFLASGPGSVLYARQFAARRESLKGEPGMNRLYSVEPTMTVTGANADHRQSLRAFEIAPFAQALAKALGVKVPEPADLPAVKAISAFTDALVKDLESKKGKSLVVAGGSQPPYVHALALAMNQALGNIGTTVEVIEPVEAEPVDQAASLVDLVKAANSGAVDMLLILGGNPAYTAPADSGFAAALGKIGFKARLGLYEDETTALCDWHVPETHEFEVWGDVRAFDGTATIQQPLIAPLYGEIAKSSVELIAALLKGPSRDSYEIVQETWRDKAPKGESFDTFWKTSVHEGVVAGSASAVVKAEVKADLGAPPVVLAAPDDTLEVVFRPDPTVWDGRFSNNAWLQELPKPITKLTWDNAALFSLATAEKLGVTTGDMVELTFKGLTVQAPVLINPGQANGSVTVHFGYGRSKVGQVGKGAGFNAFAIQTLATVDSGIGLEVKKLGTTFRLACTQLHRNVELVEVGEAARERHMVRVATFAEYKENPNFAHSGHDGHEPGPEITLFNADPPPDRNGEPDYAWGMVINLNTCNGCGSCVAACVAENNITVVGRDQVLRSREMHWLEIDRYYEGSPESPTVYHQPRACMHCEKAPCEVVCPVAATLHDSEGLNVMVYNRCVGTRYCSNNCPYKVRHFNFLQYANFPESVDKKNAALALVNNPEVTIRTRGVMEKCTYCTQRINEARYKAELEDRGIRDGDIVTACQGACPAKAITFGNINDPSSAVAKLKADSRNYGMLAELNTRTRTSYLAKLWNPNPSLAVASPTSTSTSTSSEKEASHHGI